MRNPSRRVLVVSAVAGLLAGACMGGGGGNSGTFDFGGAPTAPVTGAPLGDAIGTGAVTVGLILPQTAQGGAAETASSLRNAAEMALAEFNNPNIRLVVKDDRGTPQGAQEAAQAAISEGAQVIIGPVFAQSVAAAGQVAQQAGVPLIGFSTDANVATRGVYLLSFLPETDVDRIVSHAVRSGKRSFAALLPDTAYGTVAEAAFREAVARAGGRVVAMERHSEGIPGAGGAVRRVAEAAAQADAIFMPASGDQAPQLAAALASAGVDFRRVQLLGTGLWDDPAVTGSSAMTGARFAAPDASGFQGFAQRYSQRYGGQPVRTATLAYDAVSLVAALVQTQGGSFSAAALTNSSGFRGVDGVFRFTNSGTNQRGLAVMEVTGSGARVVDPAPQSFASASL